MHSRGRRCVFWCCLRACPRRLVRSTRVKARWGVSGPVRTTLEYDLEESLLVHLLHRAWRLPLGSGAHNRMHFTIVFEVDSVCCRRCAVTPLLLCGHGHQPMRPQVVAIVEVPNAVLSQALCTGALRSDVVQHMHLLSAAPGRHHLILSQWWKWVCRQAA